MANQLNSSFVGVWQPVKAEVKLFKGIYVSFENAPYTLDLKEDGTAMVTKEKAVSGTWTESDGAFPFTTHSDWLFSDISQGTLSSTTDLRVIGGFSFYLNAYYKRVSNGHPKRIS